MQLKQTVANPLGKYNGILFEPQTDGMTVHAILVIEGERVGWVALNREGMEQIGADALEVARQLGRSRWVLGHAGRG